MSKALDAYMGAVAELGCVICRRLGHGPSPAQLHHPREGLGGAQRASDWLVIPLCEPHHTGSAGIHGLGRRGFERRYGVDEMDMLAQTIKEMNS